MKRLIYISGKVCGISLFLCYNPYMSKKIEKNEKGVIKISVRDLVEFILREGDIDNRHGRGASAEAMLAGGRIHRKIQKRMGSNYHAEVPLKIAIEEDEYQLVIEGRADGILIESAEEEITFADNFNHMTMPEDCKVTIDEIKGMYMKLDLLDDAVGVHRAQAMCYAYIYALQHDLATISVQMTYCNLDTEDIRYFHYDYTFEELAVWFEKLITEYKKWADFQFAWKKLRQASIKLLQFPFSYREGQKELAAGVYRTISRKKNLFIQAPTGAGKTISTVFPAVKAVGEDLADKIFYLTAKTITGTVAREAFELLRKNGYQAKVLTITAKEKLCLCEEMECNPVNCPYAKGHYDRVNDAVFSLLQKEDMITREVILEQAKEYNVCPFEMCLDTATWVDDIICDYNYAFDPNVYLKRFFADGTTGDYIFLVDEAHNLVERSREMYSAIIYKEDFLLAKKILKKYGQAKLMRELDMFDTIQSQIKNGMPVLATCAGVILLAQQLSNDAATHLATLPAVVRRNAYGRQLGSFSVDEQIEGIGTFPMRFIRAPYIEKVLDDTKVLAKVDGNIVMVENKNQLAMSFHPELTSDTRIHEMFLKKI